LNVDVFTKVSTGLSIKLKFNEKKISKDIPVQETQLKNAINI